MEPEIKRQFLVAPEEAGRIEGSMAQVSEEYWGRHWLGLIADGMEFPDAKALRTALPGKVLVELGRGEVFTAMLSFAEQVGCLAYVGVDKLGSPGSVSEHETPGGFPYGLVTSDLKRYVSRLGQKDCSYCINAIDRFIIESPDYHKELYDLFTQLVLPGNLVFGGGSTVFCHFDEKDWIDHSIPGGPAEVGCFERRGVG